MSSRRRLRKQYLQTSHRTCILQSRELAPSPSLVVASLHLPTPHLLRSLAAAVRGVARFPTQIPRGRRSSTSSPSSRPGRREVLARSFLFRVASSIRGAVLHYGLRASGSTKNLPLRKRTPPQKRPKSHENPAAVHPILSSGLTPSGVRILRLTRWCARTISLPFVCHLSLNPLSSTCY